ncbi:MAG: hypothetical protein KDC84_09000 [Crocinitomicaceae bacterium]|nr:hypothetical protein [Crocinitomicaceae bacterium]
MINKSLSIFFILLLFSCAKDGKNIYVEGRVVNPVTGEGIPNITLDLRKKVPDPGGSGSDSKTVKTVLSDQNGYFTIAHNGSLFNSYIIHMSNSNGIGYHVAGWKDASGTSIGGYNLEVDKGQYMNVRYELVPYAEFKVDAYNVNCFDQTDTMLLYKQNQIGSLQEGPWIYPGCNSFLGGYNKVPMGKIYFSWHVIRNGITNIYSDTIYLDEGEQETFTINY